MIFVNGHKVSQVICLSCFRRWIAARPIDTRLDELECPDCHQQGIVIETGETSVAEDLLKQMKEQEAVVHPEPSCEMTYITDCCCDLCGVQLIREDNFCRCCGKRIEWEGR